MKKLTEGIDEEIILGFINVSINESIKPMSERPVSQVIESVWGNATGSKFM
jgi:hypothetical protein